LLLARLAIEKLAHRSTGITSDLPNNNLGLIESTMTHPLRRRWGPGQHWAGSIASDAIIQKNRQCRSKGSGRRPFASIFEVGNEWA
jgi:hypothetical protein